MVHLKGNALFACVTTLTALGFFQIGFDNGLMGGLGKCDCERLVLVLIG